MSEPVPQRIPLPRVALDHLRKHLGNGGMAAGGLVELTLRDYGHVLPPQVILWLGQARQSLRRLAALAAALAEDEGCRGCPYGEEPGARILESKSLKPIKEHGTQREEVHE